MTGTLYRMWDGKKWISDFQQVMWCVMQQMAHELDVKTIIRYNHTSDGFEFYAATGYCDQVGQMMYAGDIVEQQLTFGPDYIEYWYAEIRMVKGAWCLCQVGFDYVGTKEDPRQNLLIDIGEDEPYKMKVVGNIKQGYHTQEGIVPPSIQ